MVAEREPAPPPVMDDGAGVPEVGESDRAKRITVAVDRWRELSEVAAVFDQRARSTRAERVRVLEDLRAEGFTLAEIADGFGVTKQRISFLLHSLD